MFNKFNNVAVSLIRRYRLNSIFFIYLKRIFLIVSIPMLILIMLIVATSTLIVRKNHSEALTNDFKPITSYFEECIDDIDKFQYKLEINDNVYRFSSLNINDNYLNVSRLSMAVSSLLVNYTASSPHVTSVHIYFPYADYIISNREANSLQKYSSSNEFKSLPDNLYHYFISSDNSDTLKYIRPMQKEDYTYAIVQYDIDLSTLAHINDQDSLIMLLDHNNKPIYNSNTELAKKVSREDISKLISPSSKPHTSGGYILAGQSICNSQFGVIFSRKSSTYAGYKSVLIITVLGILLLMILLPLTIALYFSFRFYSIISDVIFKFNLTDMNESSHSNELELLNNSIFNIMQRNQIVESELILNSQKLIQAQTQALQLQISPHFIFNTLNLTNVIIMREFKRNNDAQLVIYHLANLISEVLNTKDNIVTVYDELEYVKEFIEIEKIRFQNGFDVIYDIDESVYERKTIKFILQPIVENAFEHGIKQLESRRGRLEIKAFCHREDTIFTVTDNGDGFDPDTLSSMIEVLRANIDTMPGRHIGVYNVHQRISLLCGDDYGVSIASEPGNTTVTIRIKSM